MVQVTEHLGLFCLHQATETRVYLITVYERAFSALILVLHTFISVLHPVMMLAPWQRDARLTVCPRRVPGNTTKPSAIMQTRPNEQI